MKEKFIEYVEKIFQREFKKVPELVKYESNVPNQTCHKFFPIESKYPIDEMQRAFLQTVSYFSSKPSFDPVVVLSESYIFLDFVRTEQFFIFSSE